MSNWLIERSTALLDRGTTRRGFLTRSALVGTALAVAPVAYVLRPQTAYATICSCNGSSCNCTDLCCDGYTEFCCTLTGSNSCPPGTIAAGWWKADNSGYCDVDGASKPRYYIDCNGNCDDGCGCGSSGVCSRSCSDTTCQCGNGDCGNRKSGCTGFRYGQCNNHIECVGRIVCRVVTCTPPWQWEESCTTASATDNYTRFHNRPCLHGVEETSAFPGVVSGTEWTLRESGLEPVNTVFDYGEPGDIFVMGDWNGNGERTPGIVRGAKFGPYGGKLTWLLRNSNSGGPPDIVIEFGTAGDQPVVGDWNGDGADSIGVMTPAKDCGAFELTDLRAQQTASSCSEIQVTRRSLATGTAMASTRSAFTGEHSSCSETRTVPVAPTTRSTSARLEIRRSSGTGTPTAPTRLASSATDSGF